MTVETTVKIAGVKEALIALRKIDPELRKEFQREVTQVAAPAIQAGKDAYKFLPISGFSRKWAGPAVGGRQVFPTDIRAAQKGVKLKVDTSRRATSTIYIQQTSPAWAIFETAGRANANKLANSLGDIPRPGTTRLIGRAVYAARDKIQREVERVVLAAVNTINGRIR